VTAAARIYALALLQLVVTLGWMAYAHFQPVLAERFGPGILTGVVAAYFAIAGPALAPLVGEIGDRIARRDGSRFPLLVAGGLLAGATFVAVSAVLTVGDAAWVRWVLCGLVLLWIAAMTILQAPALSLLPAAASVEGLPAVASPLVVATVLPAALWPFVRRGLDGIGGSAAYLAGGVLVVAATFLLRNAFATASPATRDPAPPSVERPEPVGIGLAVVFALGIASALVTRLAFEVVPRIVGARVELVTPDFVSTATLGIATFLSPSLGSVGAALGSGRGVIVSVAVAVACGLAAPFAASLAGAAAVAIALGAALALHLDCALPYALGSLPLSRAGLSSGLYLGGVFAGTQLAAVAPSLTGLAS
jgi:hypothetical protein